MARPQLSAAAAAVLALVTTACDRVPHWDLLRGPPSSVTVRLPPARAAVPAPGFEAVPENHEVL